MSNILFAGSKVLNGYGTGLVITTGGQTEMGKIAQNIQSTEDERTPLQKNSTTKQNSWSISHSLLQH